MQLLNIIIFLHDYIFYIFSDLGVHISVEYIYIPYIISNFKIVNAYYFVNFIRTNMHTFWSTWSFLQLPIMYDNISNDEIDKQLKDIPKK